MQLRIVSLQASEIHLGQFRGLHFSSSHHLRQCRDSGIRELIDACGPSHDGNLLTNHLRGGDLWHCRAGRQRVEDKGGKHVASEWRRVKLLIIQTRLREALRDGRALIVGELDPRDLLCRGDHFLGDRRALLWRLIRLRPEHAGEERRAEPDAGEIRHEGATVVCGLEVEIHWMGVGDGLKVRNTSRSRERALGFRQLGLSGCRCIGFAATNRGIVPFSVELPTT